MENIVINVHESNLDLFNEKLVELNKKFAKKHLPLISCSMEQKEVSAKDEFDHDYTYVLYTATLSSEFNQTNLKGVDVEFEGVVSLVDMNEKDKIYSLKNTDYVSLLSDCSCDECHKKISRSKYLVFSRIGKEVQTRDDLIVLGRNCAKNYFPFDIQNYFGYLEEAFGALTEFDEFNGHFSHLSKSCSLYSLYLATCAVTDNFKVYQTDGITKEAVMGWINNDKIDRYNRYRDVYPIPDSAVPYDDMKSYINESFNQDDLVQFDLNIRSVLFRTLEDNSRELRDEISKKYTGIAIYGIFSAKQKHDREVEKKLAEEKRLAENAKVEYFGAVGDKFELTLTFDKMFGFETQYGYQYIILFHDDENHKFKWSSSCGNLGKNFNWAEYEVGHEYLIKGTIKDHQEYKGCKQTVITRCKVLNNFHTEESTEDKVIKYDDEKALDELLNATSETV